MKIKSILLGMTICISLLLLFLFSVFIARVMFGERTDIILGEGVGVVEIKGLIVDSRETIKQMEEFRKNESVKALVLRVDSPGGVVGPSQEIYEQVKKFAVQKRVVVSMGSVAASGGYYVAAPANRIFANPGTVTGSIGVLMKLSNIEGLMGKIGLKSFVLKSGRLKDAGSPVRAMTREERAYLQGIIDNMHGQFIRAVADGRKLPLAEVTRLADGRIFTGEQALQVKLVDRLGNLQDAIAEAGKLAGIKGEPQVIYPPEKKRRWLELLMEDAVENLVGRARRDAGFKVNYEFDGSVP